MNTAERGNATGARDCTLTAAWARRMSSSGDWAVASFVPLGRGTADWVVGVFIP